MTDHTPTTAAGRRAEADWNTLADSGDVYAWQDGTDISVHITGHILAIEAEAPLDVERLYMAILVNGLEIRPNGGAWMRPRDAAEALAREYAALEEPTP